MLDFIRHWFDRRIVERSDVTEGQFARQLERR
jgi:hypothetical protein